MRMRTLVFEGGRSQPMVSQEDIVALVVECDDSASHIVSFLWEKTVEHPRYGFADTCLEVVQNELRIVIGGFASILELFKKLTLKFFKL
jgi:hypothetical protein